MSVKPRTIDNMGIDTSSRYARDKAQLDTKLIEESRFIPQKAEVSVVKPYIATEFEQYLLPNKLTLWAIFAPPPNYFAYEKPLFTYQLIPSLGGWEKQDADTDKIAALLDTLNKPKKGKQGQKQQKEETQEELQEKMEIKLITNLLQVIGKLDRTLGLINSRRNQYQRG